MTQIATAASPSAPGSVAKADRRIIPYASGYFSIKDMAKAGVWMTVAAAVSVALSISLARLVGV